MAPPDLVMLLGNGLSVAANPRLSLESLTGAFLESHATDRDDLDRLLGEVDLGHVDPTRDFEGIVAGLESAEEIVSSFMRLASRIEHPDLREAAALLEERGVPQLIRRLFYAYCAEVLDAIGTHALGSIPAPVIAFGGWMKEMHQAHTSTALFTLNYDLLLERMLIDDDVLGLQRALTDFFSGLPERTTSAAIVPGGDPLAGRLFYPADPPMRAIHLHHLHGCLTHFRSLKDGQVWKFASSDIRDHDIFGRLAAAEESDFVPSVILGSRKVEKSKEWPFSYGFLALEAAARSARTVVVVGYSFRDSAVNTRLSQLARTGDRRWILIDRALDAAQANEYTEKVESVLGDVDVEFHLGGLDAALPQVA